MLVSIIKELRRGVCPQFSYQHRCTLHARRCRSHQSCEQTTEQRQCTYLALDTHRVAHVREYNMSGKAHYEVRTVYQGDSTGLRSRRHSIQNACVHACGGANKQCNDSCTAAHAVQTTTCYQYYIITATYHRLKASGGQAGATLGSSRLQPERP